MKRTVYQELDLSTGFMAVLGFFGLFVLAGLGSAWFMEHHGHVVTGMNNRIVWGMPHVFAITLIIAASGILNVASIGSVFGKTVYKPMGRLSGVLAIAFLIGGLIILVLDLGHPDRLIVAMTHYNFSSIFAWNLILYTGFMVIVAVYLFVQMDRQVSRNKSYTKTMGWFAFIWRLVLTTGTGSIFGWLVARQAYDAAIMAPLFIALSLSLGMAIFILVVMFTYKVTERPLGDKLLNRMARLMGIFAAVVLYFTALQMMTNNYAAEHSGIVRFILLDGGVYTTLFWVVQVILGGLVPIALVYFPATGQSRSGIALASALIIAGAFAQIYVTVVGGQAYPLVLFPGMEVSSSYQDGVVAAYSPSLPEIGLGLGGVALALAISAFAMKVLRLLPKTLADSAVDPHAGAA